MARVEWPCIPLGATHAYVHLTSHAINAPPSSGWFVDEANNAGGPNRCNDNCNCDGLRVCDRIPFIAVCEGTSRPVAPHCDTRDYYHDESYNTKGYGACSSKCDCDGLRTCSELGSCQGMARNLTM